INASLMTSWHLNRYNKIFYCPPVLSPAEVAGAAGCGNSAAGPWRFSIPLPSKSLESDEVEFEIRVMLDSNIKATNIVANVHVLLSKKSPVFFTPQTT